MGKNMGNVVDVTFVNKNTGEEELFFSGLTVANGSVEHKSSKGFPRSFVWDNTPANKNIYEDLLSQVGKDVCLESYLVNGRFNVSLDGEKVVLKEVLEG